MKYYNPKKILSMKDLDDDEPNIYIITTNRSAGKTTAFLKIALQKFRDTGKKTILMYRYNYELSSANDIFKDVLTIDDTLGKEVTALSHARGLFYELFLDKKSFGYAISLSNTDSLKKYSPLFADVEMIIFDEFQSEVGKYLPHETDKIQSAYLTIARGGGSQSRNVKMVLLGNMITIMNPYFVAFGIHKRLKSDTKFMRGNGWVAEFGYNKSASESIKSNSFFKAFKQSDYMTSSTEKKYMYDSNVFIEKPTGKSKYICTISYEKTLFGVREFYEDGKIYVSAKPDLSCQQIMAFKPSDHTQNTVMVNRYSYVAKILKNAFNNGFLYFDDVKAKMCIFDILSIDLYK